MRNILNIVLFIIMFYSFFRLFSASRQNSKGKQLVNIVSKPGLWLQGLTTAEPTDDIIEVGIASVEAVFDWKKFQEENM